MATADLSDLPDAAGRRLRSDAVRNRQRILAAAQELFARRGLSTTLDDVAAHAGVGVGTVYRRFANKQELIDGVFEQSIDRLAARADNALTNPDPWAAIAEFLEFVCSSLAENRGLSAVVMGKAEMLPRIAARRERLRPVVAEMVERARKAGVVRPDIEAADLFALMHMVDGFARFAHPANSSTWQRYFVLALDSLRPNGFQTPLPVPPLSPDELDRARLQYFGKPD